MSLGSQIIYKQMFQRHGCVRIPMIQRDYAQGRPAEAGLREEFLKDIEKALRKRANDPELPLNLDFIYGSVEGEGETRFLPLDGQQRLTTLFLLHWYLAWRDDQWEVFKPLFQVDQRSRFAYSVRPSSNEFFDEFVGYRPVVSPDDVMGVAQLISDQPWYFRSWRLDPTIQSVLCMLDAIHKRFKYSNGLFSRLTDEKQPAITFQLLDLKNFGLSDDLYIKMNARGKPLTQFETFKARYEQELERQFEGATFTIGEQNFAAGKYVALRMDTAWTDLFWRLRDDKKSNLYDGALMNMFRAVALVTRSPDDGEYVNDIILLKNGSKAPSYADFYSRKWLDERFTLVIIHLLDAWSTVGGKLSILLPDQRYFDEKAVFNKIVSNGADLSFVELIQFAAYAGFVAKHQDGIDAKAFQEWMRIVHNLSVNSDYHRPDDLRRSIAGLNHLRQFSEDVLTHFAETDNPANGFSPQQIAEEKLKAELIQTEGSWRPLIDRAEGHGYFRGQIEFLLDFCGVAEKQKNSGAANWGCDAHVALQAQFENYLKKAETMFNARGLVSLEDFRWERALLSIGDYTLPSGSRNYSFLVNTSTDQASWKRLLRGTGPEVPEARKLLNQLFDRLSEWGSLEEQLDKIIAEATGLELWRQALIKTPKALEYCSQLVIRWNAAEDVYLLKKSQMNGAHAELFTYCFFHNSLERLNKQGSMAPLELCPYQEVNSTDTYPHDLLVYMYGEIRLDFRIYFESGSFITRIRLDSLDELQNIKECLCNSADFQEHADDLSKSSSQTDLEGDVLKLAKALKAISSQGRALA
jgi:hypothetical protein